MLVKTLLVSFEQSIKSEFHKVLRPEWARFKHFPVALSKDLLLYTDSMLERQNFKAVVIHIEIITW